MKILVTSDPHDCLAGCRFADVASARGCDLFVIAGDFIDMLLSDPSPEAQSSTTVARLFSLARVVPVAGCSGNHDALDPSGAAWLKNAARECPALIADGDHAVFEDALVVSVIGYWNIWSRDAALHALLRQRAQEVWEEGRDLASSHRVPWMVVHHEPPAGTRVDASGEPKVLVQEEGDGGSDWCRRWIERFRPDYVVSGHNHAAFFQEGGGWADQVPGTPTWCFNPGRVEGPPWPQDRSGLIEVDTRARTAKWFPPWNVAGRPEILSLCVSEPAQAGAVRGN